MKDVEFITKGGDKYFPTIDAAASQLLKLYPQSLLYIYDEGFSKSSINSLKEYPNVKVIEWENTFEPTIPVIWKIESILKNNRYSNFILNSILEYEYPFIQQRFRHYANQKMYTIKHCYENFCSDCSLIYIDPDVIPINPVDEIFSKDFDIGVTLRPIEDRSVIGADGHPHILNSGVILLGKNNNRVKCVLDEWIRRTNMADTIEQTSLTNIYQDSLSANLEELVEFEKYYHISKYVVNNTPIQIITLPSNIFNFVKIERGIDENNVKFAHFKSGRYKDEKYTKIIEEYRK